LRECSDLQQKKTIPELHDDSLPLFCAQTKIPSESKLINDDCLKALSSILNHRLIFALPTHLTISKRNTTTGMTLWRCRNISRGVTVWLSELARVLKPGRTLAVINIPLWAVRHYQHLSKTLQFQSWIAWDGLSLPVRMIMPSHYAIVCFSKGEPRPLPGLNSDFLSTTEGKKSLPMGRVLLCATVLSGFSKPASHRQTEQNSVICGMTSIELSINSRRVDHPWSTSACTYAPSFQFVFKTWRNGTRLFRWGRNGQL